MAMAAARWLPMTSPFQWAISGSRWDKKGPLRNYQRRATRPQARWTIRRNLLLAGRGRATVEDRRRLLRDGPTRTELLVRLWWFSASTSDTGSLLLPVVAGEVYSGVFRRRMHAGVKAAKGFLCPRAETEGRLRSGLTDGYERIGRGSNQFVAREDNFQRIFSSVYDRERERR
ncbi:subunits of heterodimeric actin filament capping protein Capz superfamily [Striga asiatica]|uniref:Subunits of heterodimeric actin filament capping protein Capz superfamily n=1 Tax=Striga asiatica TaxID=4170 RepID=A0A5A7QHG9_STRAF|nr:subunits of heterodimeric actin filament capping protein Capz superfamily [Striga asiatica]